LVYQFSGPRYHWYSRMIDAVDIRMASVITT